MQDDYGQLGLPLDSYVSEIKESDEPATEKTNRTYLIPVSSGIFDHLERIGDALWLFLWLIHRTTAEHDGVGEVCGGVSCVDADIAGVLGCSTKVIKRWRTCLLREGYILVHRSRYGFQYQVLRSKRFSHPRTSGVFRIPISSGILEHFPRMGDSVWLFIWLIDAETSSGTVLGGRPLQDQDIAVRTGWPAWRVKRWRRWLLHQSYISVCRTRRGFVYEVAKSKKYVRPGRSGSHA